MCSAGVRQASLSWWCGPSLLHLAGDSDDGVNSRLPGSGWRAVGGADQKDKNGDNLTYISRILKGPRPSSWGLPLLWLHGAPSCSRDWVHLNSCHQEDAPEVAWFYRCPMVFVSEEGERQLWSPGHSDSSVPYGFLPLCACVYVLSCLYPQIKCPLSAVEPGFFSD